MPLIDIATAQPSFQNNIFTRRAQTLLHNKFVFGNEKGLASGWKSFRVPKIGKNCYLGSSKNQRSALVIQAVATLESKHLVQSNGEHERRDSLQQGVDSASASGIQNQSTTEDSEEVGEREKLRRERISLANKGNRPWNLGRKHSAETRQLIKERTRLAMQDPKVKKKLVILGRSQSEETRTKIGVGVRMGWERRREKVMLQETCFFDWQNLIAEASRRGFVGEEELQWDSYKMLSKQLEQDFLESIELRKKTPRPKGNKRAPKSPEQRRKISETISAKWADPEYRDRVTAALSKYHGTRVGAERKPKKQPSGERQPRAQSPTKWKAKVTASPIQKVTKPPKKNSTKLRRNMPLYKDPLASSKLEMIKNIRSQRSAAETKKTEAVEHAKLLIAEAEMAAKALEAAAMRSPIAYASLIETRKLIAEAIQSLQSMENVQICSNANGQKDPSVTSVELLNHTEKESNGKISSTQAVESRNSDIQDFGFGKFDFQYLLNGNDEVRPTEDCDLQDDEEEFYRTGSGDHDWSLLELNGVLKQSGITEKLSQPKSNGIDSLLRELSPGGAELELQTEVKPPSVLEQSGITEEPSQLKPNGKDSLQRDVPPGGAELKLEKEVKPPSSITVTKKWVRGKLVEVAEVD